MKKSAFSSHNQLEAIRPLVHVFYILCRNKYIYCFIFYAPTLVKLIGIRFWVYVWGMMREGRGKITITKRTKNMIIPAHSQLHTNIYIAIHLYIWQKEIFFLKIARFAVAFDSVFTLLLWVKYIERRLLRSENESAAADELHVSTYSHAEYIIFCCTMNRVAKQQIANIFMCVCGTINCPWYIKPNSLEVIERKEIML